MVPIAQLLTTTRHHLAAALQKGETGGGRCSYEGYRRRVRVPCKYIYIIFCIMRGMVGTCRDAPMGYRVDLDPKSSIWTTPRCPLDPLAKRSLMARASAVRSDCLAIAVEREGRGVMCEDEGGVVLVHALAITRARPEAFTSNYGERLRGRVGLDCKSRCLS